MKEIIEQFLADATHAIGDATQWITIHLMPLILVLGGFITTLILIYSKVKKVAKKAKLEGIVEVSTIFTNKENLTSQLTKLNSQKSDLIRKGKLALENESLTMANRYKKEAENVNNKIIKIKEKLNDYTV